MAFNTDTRNKLARMVADARTILRTEFTSQLQEIYGIQPDGNITDIEKLSHLNDEQLDVARLLRERVVHLASGMENEKKPILAAIDRMTREQSFTLLNRFAALRMSEERKLIQQCVGAGMDSEGFAVYLQIAGTGLGNRFERFCTFIFCVFDEIAVDLGILFDRFSPIGLLFPRESALERVLDVLNHSELKHLWAEDEAIGWIYQYFNSPEERKSMRNASQAPRNSRELAVRNQFFTPRYVVEFLTDNTLGRIWYEMRKGDTVLKNQCRYLVRRPNEIFLAPGEKPPGEPDDVTDLSQEELLKKTVHIEPRSKKDPRDLRVVDPACGSGHFLLYAFDLLERIYEESWGDPESPNSEATGRTLREDFATLNYLRRAVPKLIIEHNLHGIDIDPRAVQIAALALWLRAQKSWKSRGIKVAERPQIVKSNIVTAEPMPGEEDMRREFTAGLKPRVLGQLVDVVFEKMELAGDAGSLLKIEEEIKDAVTEARKQWLEGPKPEQLPLSGMADTRSRQQNLRFYFNGVTNERFWEQVEDHILEALKDYAEKTENGQEIRRRLFVKDASRGFAFIDLCRKRYDVALLNPPFGLPIDGQQYWLKHHYANAYVDLYPAMVCRAAELVPNGLIGAVSSRSFLFAKTLTEWRVSFALQTLRLLLDLGRPVMDGAMVEACASVVVTANPEEEFIVIDCRDEEDKGEAAERLICSEKFTAVIQRSEIQAIFRGKLLYKASRKTRALLKSHSACLGSEVLNAKQGLKSFNDFRFFRLRWEVCEDEIHKGKTWEPITRGGGNDFFFTEFASVVRWQDDGIQIAEENRKSNGQTAQARQASRFYHKSGGTYTWRSNSFRVALLPRNVIIGGKGPAIIPAGKTNPYQLIGLLNSAPYRALVELQANANQYETGIIERLPAPIIKGDFDQQIGDLARKAFILYRSASLNDATSVFFRGPLFI